MTDYRVVIRALAATAGFALLLTLALGLHGLGRPGLPQIDFPAYYGGGCFLLDGESPYTVEPTAPPRMAEQGEKMRPFAYAPNISPLSMVLCTLTYTQARYAYNTFNVIAVVAFGLGAGLLAAVSRPGRERALTWREVRNDRESLFRGVMVMLIAWAPPYASHSLWFGNIAAITMAFLVWAWWLAHRGRPVTAGVLLGLAALKPPAVLLPGLWLLLQRRWSTLAVAGVVVVAMSLPMMLQMGAIGAWLAWLDGIRAYASIPENQPTGEFVLGLRSVLMSVGIQAPDVTIVGVIAAVLTWRYLRPLSPGTSLALMAAITLVFFHGHSYALLWLAVIGGAWLETVGMDRRWLAAGAAALLAFLMPREVLRIVEAPDWVLRYRTVELLLVTAVMVWLIARARRSDPERYSPSGSNDRTHAPSAQ